MEAEVAKNADNPTGARAATAKVNGESHMDPRQIIPRLKMENEPC